jgi:hypothetical protein
MNAAQLIGILNSEGHSLTAKAGKLIVEPKLKADRRAQVREFRERILEELNRYPGRIAKARDFSLRGMPPRPDELPARPRRPVAITRNPWIRRRGRPG